MKMMSAYQNRIQQSAFNTWLDQAIYYDGIAYARRANVILNYIRDLRMFIASKGYAFRTDEVSMAKAWARFLFLHQTRLHYRGNFAKNPLSRPEDYTMYCDQFDSQDREGFEELLARIEDFDPSTSKGCTALAAIFPFSWYYIDVNNSSATEMVDDMLEGSDGEEDGDMRPKRLAHADPYLVDQANAASKYNRWD
jgi:hypothetical protein